MKTKSTKSKETQEPAWHQVRRDLNIHSDPERNLDEAAKCIAGTSDGIHELYVSVRALREFARWCLARYRDDGDMESEAVERGLLTEVVGGFNPELHEDPTERSVRGDEWYEPTSILGGEQP